MHTNVVMAMCTGALREYLIEHDALPDAPLPDAPLPAPMPPLRRRLDLAQLIEALLSARAKFT